MHKFVKNMGIMNILGSGFFCYGEFKLLDSSRDVTGNITSILCVWTTVLGFKAWVDPLLARFITYIQ